MNASTSIAGIRWIASALCATVCSGSAAAQVHNLGIAGDQASTSASSSGLGLAFLASEEGQGGVDLNGDGDTDDFVVHVASATGGTSLNLGLAIDGGALPGGRVGKAGSHVVALVSEERQGGVDLNGDGDTLDRVAHVHDLASGTTTNLGLAGGYYLRLAPGSILMGVSEVMQGDTDLNGDGDASDRVAHHIDLSTLAVANLGVALGSPHGPTGDADLWGFRVSEFDQGADLDGDGQIAGQVAHLYEPATGTLTNLGPSSRDVYGVAEGRALLGRDEAHLGADLNQDGDQVDFLLEIWEPSTATNLRTGLVLFDPFSYVFSFVDQGLVDGRRAFLPVHEIAQGIDLNGDGDLGDPVLHQVSLVDGKVQNLGIVAYLVDGVATSGARAWIPIMEYYQGGLDLNGDGDGLDEVLHEVDLATGTLTSLGLATSNVRAGPTGLMGFTVSEAKQAQTDLNGDGDTADTIHHFVEPGSGQISSLRLSSDQFGLTAPLIWQLGPDAYAFGAQEGFSGSTDLNGDGDHKDMVLLLFTPSTGVVTNLGLALGYYHALAEGALLFTVNEFAQGGSDLNGDGDANDLVMHVLYAP